MRTETDLEQILYLFRDHFPLCDREHPQNDDGTLSLGFGNRLVGSFR
jgi:hypothetical protein